jgi:hypothetical protein
MRVASVGVARKPGRVRDEVSSAVARLEEVLPARTDSKVLLELLEDGLREGLSALAGVEEHFQDLLAGMQKAPGSPANLVDIGDNARVLDQLDTLVAMTSEIRRRLSQAAGKIHNEGRSRITT